MADRNAAPLSAAVGTAMAVGLAAYIWSRRAEKKKIHVEYDHHTPPVAIRFIASLPNFLRRPLAVKGAAPKPPVDGIDIRGPGNYNPYTKDEIVPGKLWRVRYKFIQDPKMGKALKDIFGLDLQDPALLERVPPHMRERVKKDMEIAARNERLAEGSNPDQELLNAGSETSQDMLVALLDGPDNEGELLLYNPCRMHPPMMEWLNSLGNVSWIVSGSSSHTNQIPQAAKAFPSAKIVCAANAEEKCVAVGMRSADFVYTDPSALAEANRLLKDCGARMYHIRGDTFTHALFVLVHGHIFECDLLYGHADGTRWATTDKADFETEDSLFGGRLFFFGAICTGTSSPNGLIPCYRFMGMDPTSPLAGLMLDRPEPDGSSCKQMANSLREAMKLDFVAADPAHSFRAGSMPADEFRDCIDKSWRWLDGKSLLAD